MITITRQFLVLRDQSHCNTHNCCNNVVVIASITFLTWFQASGVENLMQMVIK